MPMPGRCRPAAFRCGREEVICDSPGSPALMVGVASKCVIWGGGGRTVSYAKHVMLLRPSALALRMVDFHVGVMVRAYNEED